MCQFIEGSEEEYISNKLKDLFVSKQNYNHNKDLLEQKLAFQEKLEIFKAALRQKYRKSQAFFAENRDLYTILCTERGVRSVPQRYRGTPQNTLISNDLFCEDIFEISFSSERFNNHNFSIYTKLTVVRETCSFKVTSTLLRNCAPVIPKTKAIRLLLCRYLNRLNSSMADGHFRFNCLNGFIQFHLNSVLMTRVFSQLILEPRKGMAYVQAEINKAVAQMSFNCYKILYLMEEISLDYIYYLESLGFDFKFIPRDEEKFEMLKKIVENSNYDFEFMVNGQINRTHNQKLVKQIVEKSKHRYEQSNIMTTTCKDGANRLKQYFNNLDALKTVVTLLKPTYKTLVRYFEDYQNTFISHLITPISKATVTHDLPQIMSQIFIFDSEQVTWEPMAEGGFSVIEKAQPVYVYITTAHRNLRPEYRQEDDFNNEPIYKKFMARKSEKYEDTSKIMHEKKILLTIRDQNCPHICKFFYSLQPQHEKYLYMDAYAWKSLDFYRVNNPETLSLMTKLYFLIQTIQGLRFLRDNRIIHLDMKPQNLLIGRTLNVKISDFGEAYHPEVCNSQYRPGYTMPYPAPEVFKSIISFSQRMDVVSFGVIMHEVLFDCFPLERRRLSNDKLIENYKFSRSVLPVINPERACVYGPKELTGLLCSLCVKCLQKNSYERPSLEWLHIILKESILYLEKVY